MMTAPRADTIAMTYDDLKSELAKYTYRPKWTLEMFNDPYEGPTLYVVASVVDGYDATKTIDLGIKSPIPPMRSPGHFSEWLLWRLLRIESHECREMLRYDGKLVADPHAEDG